MERRNLIEREGTPETIRARFSKVEEPAKDAHMGGTRSANMNTAPLSLALPFEGEYPLTLGFGEVYPNDNGALSNWRLSGQPHNGLDFALPKGTRVRAAADGTIAHARWNQGGYGVHLILSHGNGYETVYAHLLTTSLPPGTVVKRGQVIAMSGSSGYSTGPHLHFELRKDGKAIDPAPMLEALNRTASASQSSVDRPTWRVSCDCLNVRSGPGLAYAVVRQLHRGEDVNEFASESSQWIQIGEREWVAATYRNEALMKRMSVDANGRVPKARIRGGKFR